MADSGTETLLKRLHAETKESVGTHKRSAAAHRRSARRLMEKLHDLEIQCKRLGINLEIDIDQGGHSHGSADPRSQHSRA